MKKLTIIGAVLAAFVMIAGPVQSATTKPVYAKPGTPSVAFSEFDPETNESTLEVVFPTPPYANFYQVKVSPKSDMTSAFWVKSQDINANAITVGGLTPGKRYWVQVAVQNYEGVRLSPYTTARSFVTSTEPTEE